MEKYNLQDEKVNAQTSNDPVSMSQKRNIIRQWIIDWLISHLKISKASLTGDTVLAEHGLDSVLSVELISDLEDRLHCDLEDTLLWNYTSVDALVDYLMSENLLNQISCKKGVA